MKAILIFTLFTFSLLAKSPGYFKEEGVIAGGYDLVSYLKERKAVKGNSQISTVYDNEKIYFSTQANKELFLKSPAKYIPAYNGYCAYAMAKDGSLVESDPKSFKIVDDKTLLFYNGFWANTLEKWNELKNDNEQFSRANKNWKKLI